LGTEVATRVQVNAVAAERQHHQVALAGAPGLDHLAVGIEFSEQQVEVLFDGAFEGAFPLAAGSGVQQENVIPREASADQAFLEGPDVLAATRQLIFGVVDIVIDADEQGPLLPAGSVFPAWLFPASQTKHAAQSQQNQQSQEGEPCHETLLW